MGSSKKYTAGHKYKMGQHHVLLNGPIDYISKIKFDGDKTAWSGRNTGGTITVVADSLFGGEDGEGGVSGQIDVLMGKPDQTRNTYLQSILGAAIPAFRGVVSLIFKQFYFGNSPYLKPLSIRATRTNVRDDDGKAQWYLPTASIYSGNLSQPHAIYITLDRSGSMNFVGGGLLDPIINNNTRLENAQAAISAVLDFIAGALTAFDLDICVVAWGVSSSSITRRSATAADIAAVKAWVNAITASGAGDFVKAFDNYASFFDGAPADAKKLAFFITDGAPSVSGQTPLANATAAAAVVATRDVPVYGINIDIDNTQYTAIVDNTHDDGVPVVTGGQPEALMSVLLGSLDLQVDMNPAHLMRECDTSPIFGLALPDADINNDNFIAAADRLYAERMGMSILWDSDSMSLDALMDEVCRHIDASHYVGQDGRVTLKLIRDDYDVDDLITLDSSNVLRVENAASTPSSELVNSVTGIYWNPVTGKNASLTVSDPALVQMQGKVKNTTIQYPGFTDPNVVARRLQSDLRALSNSLFSCTIIVNRVPEGLNIGFPFIFHWPELQQYNVVMRITDIDWGDGRNNDIRIACTEDVYALPDVAAVTPSPGWENPSKPPAPSPARVAIELPYYELVQSQGQAVVDDKLISDPEIGFFGIAAVRPSGNAINAEVYVDAGAGYGDAGYFDFCPAFTLTVEMDKLTDAVTFDSGVDLDLITPNSLAQIDGEIVSITAIDIATGTATLKRCVLDSPIQTHAIGARVVVFDEFIYGNKAEYVAGENIAIKVLPITGSGQLPIASAPADNVLMRSRAIRPYAPGQVKINGEYWVDDATGDLNITWSFRNRLQQTGGIQLGFYDAGVTPESGTTITVRVHNVITNVLIHEASGLTGSSYTVGADILGTVPSLRLSISAMRDGYESYAIHQHTFNYTGSAPLLRFSIPLTYDERDGSNSVALTRLGDAPWITPYGFDGDGYTSRYRVEPVNVPAFVASPGSVTVHASVRALRARSATRDVAISLCNDNSVARPKIELCVMKDANESTQANVAISCYTTALQVKRLCRGSWSYGFRFPNLSDGTNKIRPQAILFIDANTLLISGHYDDTKSTVFRYDLVAMSVTGMFDFAAPYVHIASAAFRASDSTYWFGEYITGTLLRVDLAASFSAGTAVVTLAYNAAAIVGFGAIDWVNTGGVDYLLAAEYATSGTRYVYVVPASTVTDGGTFAIASRLKRFTTGAARMQGVCFGNGKLYLSMNKLTADAGTPGRIQRFDILTAIASAADGSQLSPEYNWFAPSQYAEDMDFHPITGEIWTCTEGLASVASDDGWLAVWHTQLSTIADSYTPENHITVEYDGSDQVTIKINNQLFEVMTWLPTVTPEVIAIGGPPAATAGQTNGFLAGTVRNVVLQNNPMTSSQYAAAISGIDEPQTLTAYTVAITNPGAESTTTGWANEVGSIANRAGNPLPHNGASYFSGGSNVQTISRQRFGLESATGLSASELDLAAITNALWARVNWWQSSFIGDNDNGTLGVRTLDAVPAQMSLTYGAMLNMTPQQAEWIPRSLPKNIVPGVRNIDILYRADRVNGTNNDVYIDDITMTIYHREAPDDVEYSIYGAMALPVAFDGSRFIFSVAVENSSTEENYRAVAYAASGDNDLTLNRASRLPYGSASESFSAVTHGSYVTICQSNQFSRMSLSSLFNSQPYDWTTNSYSSFPVAGVGGAAEFAKLAYSGADVFTFDTSNSGIVFMATDGISFSEPSTVAGTGMRSRACKFINSTYVVGGQIYKRAAGQVDLMTSADLLTFTSHTFGFDIPGSVGEGVSIGAVLDLVGFAGDILALVSINQGADVGYNIMRSSDGGMSWVKANPTGWSSTDSWLAFAIYGSSLIVLGRGKSAITTDMVSWTVTALSDVDVILDRPIVGGSTIMCRGRKSVPSPIDPELTYQRFTAWKSNDGITFTQLIE